MAFAAVAFVLFFASEAFAQQKPGALHGGRAMSWQSLSNLMAGIFLGLTVAVFYLKHQIYQSRNIGVTLRHVVRHPAFAVLVVSLAGLYLVFMLPAAFYKCVWREYFGTKYHPFLMVMFLGLQPALVFYTFYAIEKLHIMKNATAVVFRKARTWVVALNVLLCCVLSVFLIFMWQALTASTRYSFIHAVKTACKVVL